MNFSYRCYVVFKRGEVPIQTSHIFTYDVVDFSTRQLGPTDGIPQDPGGGGGTIGNAWINNTHSVQCT